MLDEFKALITAPTTNVTKEILQCAWQEADYRWDVCRATDGDQCQILYNKLFFHFCVKELSVDEWNTANNTIVSVFIPKLQVPEILAFFFGSCCSTL
jgi:hypothetical protein